DLRTSAGVFEDTAVMLGGRMANKTLTRRVFVVLNPSSGRAVPDELERVLNQYLKSSVEEFETHWSAPGDDLAAVARAACDRGFDLVVVAGGDGTVSFVANGLVGTDARLGIIPLGTANVLAHEMGIPIASDAACRLLAEANTTATIDGMRVGDKHYFTQIGVGIDAMMIRETPAESKRRFGNVAYLWNAAKHLLGF